MTTLDPIQTVKHTPLRTKPSIPDWNIKETYKVRKGDTLSAIVREHLIATGRNVNTQSIYHAVQQVAKANDIANPDQIQVNQRIELDLPQARSAQSFQDTLKSTVISKNAPQKSTETLNMAQHLPHSQVLDGPAMISSPYGMRTHPIHKNHQHHNGIDLAAVRNTPITPMRPGTVLFSGWKPGHGNTIVIRHDDGLETQYSHAAKRLVHEGDRVSAESVLGLVGESGQATGPHLHLEVKQYGQRVNPLPYLLNDSM